MVVQGSLAAAGWLGIKIRVLLAEANAPSNSFGGVFLSRANQ